MANFTTFDSPELHKLSLRANKIKAKLTIQSTQTRLSTLNWQQLMTCAQVVKTSVTTCDNSPSQDYPHLDNQATPSKWDCFTVLLYFKIGSVTQFDLLTFSFPTTVLSSLLFSCQKSCCVLVFSDNFLMK